MAGLPFDPDGLDAKGRSIYLELTAKRKSRGAPFGGPYAALMNHPELCQKIEALGYYLKFQSHLPRDIYQFVVLAVAHETKALFEWNDHLEHALEAGVPPTVIDSLKLQGISRDVFPGLYQVAADVLISALAWQSIPPKIQDAAIKNFGTFGLIEIVVLSGFYQMFAAINQGFDINDTAPRL